MILAFAFCQIGHSETVLLSQKKMAGRLTCDFTMTRSLRVLKDTIASRGRLYLGGPGLVRFETLSPTRSVLVVNGGKAWMHYPDLGVTKNFDLSKDPAMSVLSVHLFAITSGDVSAIESAYTVVSRRKKSMDLRPKEKAVRGIFKGIRVEFGPGEIVSAVELRSANGDLTKLKFENVKTRKTISKKLFESPSK